MAWCRLAKKQNITWANVDTDLRRHMVPLGHIELMTAHPSTQLASQ